MNVVSRTSLLFVFALSPLGATAAELVCPPADKVVLSAMAPGWHDNSYCARCGPKLDFEGMGLVERMITCRYTVEGAKVVSFRRYGNCVAARGTWQEQGIVRLCQAAKEAECSLECASLDEGR